MTKCFLSKSVRFVVSSLAALAAAGAALATDAGQPASELMRLEDSKLDEVWVQASGAGLSRFNAVYLVPVAVSYRDRDPVVVLDEEELARMNEIMRDEVTEALSGDAGFAVVDEPGTGVLEIRAELTDVHINASSALGRPGVRTFVTSTGSMTLVAALRDSETGENLVLVRDHVEGRDHRFMLATQATYWAEFRNAIADWSDLLRLKLETARLAEMASY